MRHNYRRTIKINVHNWRSRRLHENGLYSLSHRRRDQMKIWTRTHSSPLTCPCLWTALYLYHFSLCPRPCLCLSRSICQVHLFCHLCHDRSPWKRGKSKQIRRRNVKEAEKELVIWYLPRSSLLLLSLSLSLSRPPLSSLESRSRPPVIVTLRRDQSREERDVSHPRI